MRSKWTMLVAALVFAWVGAAAAGDKGNVSGEVTKVEGEMVTVKMADGTSKTVHVDPKGTKKEGDVKAGAHVEADVTATGHANWIKAMASDDMKKH